MNIQAAYGLLAHGLIFGALVTLLPLGPLRARAGLIATTLALLGGIAPFVHGTFGLPSATLLQLALLQLAGRAPPVPGWRGSLALTVFATTFYSLSLSSDRLDPYALGYAPWLLLATLAVLAIVLFRKRQTSWLLILAGDLAAYAGGLFVNLWDALFDPLLVLCAAFIVLRHAARRLIASRHR